VQPIVERFARLVAPFPYDRLAHLQSSTRFGGMENAGAIFYSDAAIRRGTLPEGTVAHEIAHQWFGDAVTPRAWPHVWLSEGFATYWTELWVEHSAGDSAFRAGMARIRGQIVGNRVATARPVIDTVETDLLALLNVNSYQKGGFVLHMLRGEIGDSAFFQGVRAYYARNQHGTALTDDLRRAVEETSGRDLRWFFDQWLRRPGWAEVAWSWAHDVSARQTRLVVEQGARFGYFRFPLTVRVTRQDGTVTEVRVEVPAEERATIALPIVMDRPPARVEVDPRVEVLGAIRAR